LPAIIPRNAENDDPAKPNNHAIADDSVFVGSGKPNDRPTPNKPNTTSGRSELEQP
jgi:hypothetical protein